MRCFIIIIILSLTYTLNAQTLGGNTTFNFLKLSNTPQLTALGGINISSQTNDVGLATRNPALLKKDMHTQMSTVFTDFYAGIKNWHLSLGYHNSHLQTNFMWSVDYFDYGKITETDASGYETGILKPTDWVMQLSASRRYLTRWYYGIAGKFISSNYGIYRSNGIAFDAGVVYADSANSLSASVLVVNVGTQLKKYAGENEEELPFDLQAGITKKLKNAPVAFSLTAHHVHLFDIVYNDTINNNDFNTVGNNRATFFEKLFRHFIFSVQVNPIPQLEFTLGYNVLRRRELNIANTSNGLNGFSFGAGFMVKKLQFRYARSQYQNNTRFNQVGINLQLNEYFGLGKFGERIGW